MLSRAKTTYGASLVMYDFIGVRGLDPMWSGLGLDLEDLWPWPWPWTRPCCPRTHPWHNRGNSI